MENYDFWHKIKIYNFDPYDVFLAIATNIPQWLKTGFGFPGSHMREREKLFKNFFVLLLFELKIYPNNFFLQGFCEFIIHPIAHLECKRSTHFHITGNICAHKRYCSHWEFLISVNMCSPASLNWDALLRHGSLFEWV